MARPPMDHRRSKIVAVSIFHLHMLQITSMIMMFLCAMMIVYRQRRVRRRTRIGWGDKVFERINEKAVKMNRMVWIDDAAAINNVRMDRRAFRKFCDMISTHGKLRELSNVGVDEMVASFLNVLAHDENDGVVGRQLDSCSDSSSCGSNSGVMHFNAVLCAVLRLHDNLYKKPEPIQENCSDENWKCFKV
nr:hypothetical protein CFP56_40311 [Quercus suber]